MDEETLRYYEAIDRGLYILERRWAANVLIALFTEGPLRFSDLKVLCISQFRGSISARMLVERLRLLRTRGFIERISYGEVPPRVEYRLTAEGERAAKALCGTLRDVARTLVSKPVEQMVDAEKLRSVNMRRQRMLKKLQKDTRLRNHILKIVSALKA